MTPLPRKSAQRPGYGTIDGYNGELYIVNFSRQQVTISSYEDDANRTRIETWADGVAALSGRNRDYIRIPGWGRDPPAGFLIGQTRLIPTQLNFP